MTDKPISQDEARLYRDMYNMVVDYGAMDELHQDLRDYVMEADNAMLYESAVLELRDFEALHNKIRAMRGDGEYTPIPIPPFEEGE